LQQGYWKVDETTKEGEFRGPGQTFLDGLGDLKTAFDFYLSGTIRLTLGTFTNGPKVSFIVRAPVTIAMLSAFYVAPFLMVVGGLGGAILWRGGAQLFKSRTLGDQAKTKTPKTLKWMGGGVSVAGMIPMALAANVAIHPINNTAQIGS